MHRSSCRACWTSVRRSVPCWRRLTKHIVVDSAFEVVDAFHEKVLQLEHDVLLKPSMRIVSRCMSALSRPFRILRTISAYPLRRPDAAQADAGAAQDGDIWTKTLRCRSVCGARRAWCVRCKDSGIHES